MHGGAYQPKMQAAQSNGLYYYHDIYRVLNKGAERHLVLELQWSTTAGLNICCGSRQCGAYKPKKAEVIDDLVAGKIRPCGLNRDGHETTCVQLPQRLQQLCPILMDPMACIQPATLTCETQQSLFETPRLTAVRRSQQRAKSILSRTRTRTLISWPAATSGTASLHRQRLI